MLCNRYRILKLLGQGGFGRTFLVRDEQSDIASFCVIKQLFLQTHDSDRPRASERFQQEVQRLAELGDHPQIPQLLATFEEDGYAFIVQEWVNGWTLQQELTGAVSFDEVEIWTVLRSLLPVLQYLHEHQVIHRDLKPANLMRRSPLAVPAPLRKEGKDLVLVDFGAAKHLSILSAVNTGTLVGSAEYAAPEQLRGQAVFASDLYSLGVTCVHLLTQMPPFDLYDSSENAWKWQTYLPMPISSKLERILCKLLQPSLRQRYQTAADVLEDINLPDMNVVATRSHQPAHLFLTKPSSGDQRLFTQASPTASTAAMQAALLTRSSASVTVFEPQTQTWHHLTPTIEAPGTPHPGRRQGGKTSLAAVRAFAKRMPSVKGDSPIDLIFSGLLIVILTSVGSMTLICCFFEMERQAPVSRVERPLVPKVW
ncbi:serine/threonine-protein kinase [Stenomitos frigidus]|uniref:serine/threonine-protein kinase n=1 Tax=Stenomitos frigidus TaxID=1886765 RepID=UPI001C62748D|nr:serine/threonine-protein kinase [Stenomitos frigidus]